MAQLQKLELQVDLKSSADKVYDIFRRKLYLLPIICPHIVQDGKVIKGDWETAGSVWLWKYVAETSESTSETLEAFDDGCKSITFNALEGDVAKYYKTFKSTLCFADSGNGSIVDYTLIYEKTNQNIPDPDKYLVFASDMVKSIDAYLLNHEEKKHDHA